MLYAVFYYFVLLIINSRSIQNLFTVHILRNISFFQHNLLALPSTFPTNGFIPAAATAAAATFATATVATTTTTTTTTTTNTNDAAHLLGELMKINNNNNMDCQLPSPHQIFKIERNLSLSSIAEKSPTSTSAAAAAAAAEGENLSLMDVSIATVDYATAVAAAAAADADADAAVAAANQTGAETPAGAQEAPRSPPPLVYLIVKDQNQGWRIIHVMNVLPTPVVNEMISQSLLAPEAGVNSVGQDSVCVLDAADPPLPALPSSIPTHTFAPPPSPILPFPPSPLLDRSCTPAPARPSTSAPARPLPADFPDFSSWSGSIPPKDVMNSTPVEPECIEISSSDDSINYSPATKKAKTD